MTVHSPELPRDGVHALPLTAHERSQAWAGVLMLAVIELAALGAMIASYFYLRVGTPLWPPSDAGMPDLVLGGVGLGLLTVSAVPVLIAERAYRFRQNTRPLLWLFPVGLALVVAYVVLKVVEYAQVSYGWSSHAYGSISWTLTGYQLLHAAILVVFACVVWVFARAYPLRQQRHAAVECVALYWYFVVVSSVLEFLTTHVSAYLL